MPISLEKLNQMYGQVLQMRESAKLLSMQFQEDTECEDYENPFDLHGQFEAIVGHMKTRMEHFLIWRYQETFCRNVPVSERVRGYEEWFTTETFDAVEFINRINAEILPNDPELIAYKALRDAAKEILPDPNKPYARKNILMGHCSTLKLKPFRKINGETMPGKVDLGFGTSHHVAAFERFAQLILNNQSVFTRVAPSQLRARTPIRNGIWSNQALPQEVYAGIGHIERAVFFKNGRIDFHFQSADDCRKVVHALASDEPVITWPKHEIDMNQLFQPPKEGPRRVVKRRGNP